MRISAPLLALLALATLFAAGNTAAPGPATAGHAGGADSFSIEDAGPTPGSTAECSAIAVNSILDADEDFIDGITIDVDVNGIPVSTAMITYVYTLNYPSPEIDVIGYTHVAFPGLVFPFTDPVPDSDGTFHVSVTDLSSSGLSGSGTLDRILLKANLGATPGWYPLTLSGAAHIDTGGNALVPDALLNSSVAIDVPCPFPTDVKMISQTVTMPAVIAVGFNRAMTIDTVIHSNGPFDVPLFIDATLTLPPECTADGQSGAAVVSGSFPAPGVSVSTPIQLTTQINCSPGGSYQITIDGCADATPGGDVNQSNNCDSDTVSFDVDDSDTDGDGWTDETESGTPLCGDGTNNDDFDDAVIDDGCPGGPPQAGSFSEAQFNIGTNPLDACGTADWPGDLVIGGAPLDSTDKISILDITSFLVPTRHYRSSPGDAEFNPRWDLKPGRDVFADWINISDLVILLVVAPPAPPYNGTRAWEGPTCQ
ncbi:MAG: hypothetical protein IH957_03955 [Chloroflexi bacterium]|nr:hypothetical protein [Chloroflexota bacterium]